MGPCPFPDVLDGCGDVALGHSGPGDVVSQARFEAMAEENVQARAVRVFGADAACLEELKVRSVERTSMASLEA